MKFYSQFEISLQLDGHFWLQYALLLRRIGRQTAALEMLGKSIEAFPGNSYARHALAQQKLIVASQHSSFSKETERLIDEAVGSLMERHHSMGFQRSRGAVDEYPIVALGYYHIDALMAHDMVERAKKAARTYYTEVDRLIKTSPDTILVELKTRLAMLVSASEWRRLTYRVGQIDYK